MDADGMIGPDYNYSRADLDVFEPMGINCMVYVPRKGTYINSNQTAKQAPVSALSKVHVRELVIYLQNEIEAMMQSDQWEMNTQTLRDTIRSKADAICETIKNNGGLYAFKNVCDETNNTAEVIDNEMIILDTEIEPARGAGKMVHQLTIHKTGALSSSVK
jgi:phage tail sheath protein FI